ncbi:hypothetical protein PVIIG_03508 [Plasmodium vivax India VII]|uniref:Protein LTV1 homolog n=1 Tax=Plasmodium vivax India VII TaxID=1077284 RepID=A0A0J9SGY4_PLAVI|nr:hypothetical protein PVIIG_03508 [Plasmodium vivax India VII]
MKGGSSGRAERRGGGCRVKKVTFREPPVVCEFSENEKHEFEESSCGEGADAKTLLDETELSSLMESFDPVSFGIKEKLSESEKKILIREIYGRSGANGAFSTSVSNRKKDKKGITLREEDPVEEQPGEIGGELTSYASRQNGGSQLWEYSYYNASETSNKTGKKKKKKKKKKKRKGAKEEDPMAYLDGDCYFPNDGYNYEQHLKSISPNFVSAKSKGENNIFEVKPTDEEERELFKTFEEDNYEELNDNFVYEAQDVSGEDKLDVSKDLIWGTSDWSFPIGGASITYLAADRGRLNQLGDSEDGDTTDGGVGDAEGEAAPLPGNHHLRSGSGGGGSGGGRGDPDENGYVIFDEDNTLVHVNVEDKIKILQILNSQEEEEGHRGKGDGEENSHSDASGEFLFSSSSDESSSSLSYDCETILTTKTNTTNHPCKLVIPKKVPTPSSASPLINPLPHGSANARRRDREKEKAGEEAKLESYLVLENINTTRSKNETPEEKRERKKSVKEAQRLNRKLKKENALLMKSEKKMMNKKSNPFDIRDNVKYIKL